MAPSEACVIIARDEIINHSIKQADFEAVWEIVEVRSIIVGLCAVAGDAEQGEADRGEQQAMFVLMKSVCLCKRIL